MSFNKSLIKTPLKVKKKINRSKSIQVIFRSKKEEFFFAANIFEFLFKVINDATFFLIQKKFIKNEDFMEISTR